MTIKAGAIIARDISLRYFLLLFRSKQRDWTFPKGHVGQGETVREAVLREVREETGLADVRVIGELPDFAYEHKKESMVIIKMFLILALNPEELRPEFSGDNLEWMSIDEVKKKISYENLRSYFENNRQNIISLVQELSQPIK